MDTAVTFPGQTQNHVKLWRVVQPRLRTPLTTPTLYSSNFFLFLSETFFLDGFSMAPHTTLPSWGSPVSLVSPWRIPALCVAPSREMRLVLTGQPQALQLHASPLTFELSAWQQSHFRVRALPARVLRPYRRQVSDGPCEVPFPQDPSVPNQN